MLVRVNGETHYLWRSVEPEGGVLEVFATQRGDRRATLAFLKRTMKRNGQTKAIVSDRLGPYGAATMAMGIVERRTCGRPLNRRSIFKQNRCSALAYWRRLAP